MIQVEYKDDAGMVTGLGYDYRESLEISLRRLFSQLGVEPGTDIVFFHFYSYFVHRAWSEIQSGDSRWFRWFQGFLVSAGKK